MQERGRLGDILLREFNTYVAAPVEAGHDWEVVWSAAVWPEGDRLYWLRSRFLLARECASMVGHQFSDSAITNLGREYVEYRALFPAGPPRL
nr:hypothetical protein [Streptomyces zhihengii]